jgi:hypothetical protein
MLTASGSAVDQRAQIVKQPRIRSAQRLATAARPARLKGSEFRGAQAARLAARA